MKKLLNEKIIHIKFGSGYIADIISDNKIIAKFDDLTENKKFEYPDAFEIFLRFENIFLHENTLKELQDKKVRIAKEKEEKRAEFNKQYEEYRREERKLMKKTRRMAKYR